MEEKIWIRDLPCFREADTKKGTSAYDVKDGSFDFGLLPTEGLKEQMIPFVKARIEKLSLLSLYVDTRNFRYVEDFFAEKYPTMNNMLDVPQDELVGQYVDWLSVKGISTIRKNGKESAKVSYLRKIYTFVLPDEERPVRKRKSGAMKLCDFPAYKNMEYDKDSFEYKMRNNCFHLAMLPTKELEKEFALYLDFRSTQVKMVSLRTDIWKVGVLSSFISEKYPLMKSLLEETQDALLKELKKWMMKNGYSQTSKAYKKIYEKDTYKQNEVISFMLGIYQYLSPEDNRPEIEKDIWEIDKLGLDLLDNPIKRIATMNFTKIPQDNIRQEVKNAAYMELQTNAVGTVQVEIVAINRFCKFLAENYAEVKSFTEIDRDMIEDYLIYLNTEADSRQSYRSDLFHLRTVVDLVMRMNGKTETVGLFLISDIPKEPEKLYRSYTDEEIMKFNGAIIDIDVQVARALILHQMLGTRISDTLTLKQDCVCEKDGKLFVNIYQIKSRRSYRKPINDDVLAIINAAIEYTKERYPESPYVFAHGKDAKRPMTYAKIQYQLMAMIVDKDLRDDYGERYGVGTHLFRHTYGRKLTEMHYDDTKIAMLLGHANNSSVKYYRKMKNSQIAEESREMRQSMDEILKNLIEGW